MKKQHEHGVLILAAGNASRFGSPKQLLIYQDQTLLQRIVTESSAAGAVLVVTGAHAVLIEAQLKEIPFVRNESWEKGMGASIHTGMQAIRQLHPALQDVIILVCDQPYVTASLLQQMAEQKASTGKGIIACTYEDTIGTPVLFDRLYFDALQALDGQKGAKVLLQQFSADIATVGFPLGRVDIDTAEDYRQLVQSI
jgi:molybdenum cofactor cytidylyltransferase